MTDATFAYDDECGFCRWCAQLLVDHSDLSVLGFSELTAAQKKRLPDDWEEGAHLLTDDAVYSHGEAIEQAFLLADLSPPGAADIVQFLRQFRDYGALREHLYRAAADRRDIWGLLIRQDEPVRRE